MNDLGDNPSLKIVLDSDAIDLKFVLIDLGLLKNTDSKQESIVHVGNDLYWCPEAPNFNIKSDVFSLGALTIRMVLPDEDV